VKWNGESASVPYKKIKEPVPKNPLQVVERKQLEIPHKLDEPCFAIVHLCGTQYKLHPGDVIVTQKLLAEVGEEIILDKVLLVGTKNWTAIGTPLLPLAKVFAIVEEQTLSEKVIIFKKKRRKNYRRLKGHRQQITTLRITDVSIEKTGKINH